jgi:hypothetical protein
VLLAPAGGLMSETRAPVGTVTPRCPSVGLLPHTLAQLSQHRPQLTAQRRVAGR